MNCIVARHKTHNPTLPSQHKCSSKESVTLSGDKIWGMPLNKKKAAAIGELV
jgi:hypothetical protein